MVYTFETCKSTKDNPEIEKFIVMDCNGAIITKAKTLREAETKANAAGCAFVLKMLMTCGDAKDISIGFVVAPQSEEEGEKIFEEEEE